MSDSSSNTVSVDLGDWPLFGFGDDARPAMRRARERGEALALATIVSLDGGGPRPVGTQMTVTASAVSGFLSGGCLEGDVVSHAVAVLAEGTPRRLVYGEGSPWPDIRLLCGARIEVLLERVAPDDEAAETLIELAAARRPALWLSDGVRRACGPADAPPESWPGADPTALAIATLGAQSGCETTLVRPRGPATAPPLPGVAYSRAEPVAALETIGLDPWTAVAVATHDAELDHAALAKALPSEAFYVGALGARRRLPDRQAWLARARVGEAHIARLHAPIGLDIGGKAPWEVAIAVLAEITAERNRRVSAR
jgi:xanthine dehydrogenase accessory factor